MTGRVLLAGAGLLALAALPLWLPAYQVSIAIQVLIFAILAMSVDILAGYAGRTPLGHGAQYSVTVDGAALGQGGTVTASNAQGKSQAVSLQAALSAGKHDIGVTFLNDAYGGTAVTDRNLYVKGIDVNGTAVPGAAASLMNAGTSHFQIMVAAS